ncbi:MAG: peptidoglycan-associated lipoprotein Pal [Rhizobiales bacterium]|nr:peptidoglycan-associated lipoprotein Pal [Hyphomicrobiales bacterium]
MFAEFKRYARISIMVAMTGLVAACASNQTDPNAALGAAAPGSVAEFQSASVGDRVFFDTDSSEINAQGQAILDRQAQWLNRYPRYSFTLEGHADERGTREYNFALGARRAEAVKNYLIARGVGANRMRQISYGKERPVAVCDNISCWSQNRRVQTILSGAGS